MSAGTPKYSRRFRKRSRMSARRDICLRGNYDFQRSTSLTFEMFEAATNYVTSDS
uniref:Uncharacterized protein n=1 Tax=Anguilla anguilla TaxID=7936 RepID=A0A0E9S465_ANGAN